jgi:hypothetical protein
MKNFIEDSVQMFVIFCVTMLITLVCNKVLAASFPMWAVCKVPATASEKTKVKIPVTNQDLKFGIKNWELEKTIVIKVYGVDNRCAYVYSGSMVLTNQDVKLRCIPEKKCKPLFGAMR